VTLAETTGTVNAAAISSNATTMSREGPSRASSVPTTAEASTLPVANSAASRP
jgi:hypothetical protein